jgi:hypothetical protein
VWCVVYCWLLASTLTITATSPFLVPVLNMLWSYFLLLFNIIAALPQPAGNPIAACMIPPHTPTTHPPHHTTHPHTPTQHTHHHTTHTTPYTTNENTVKAQVLVANGTVRFTVLTLSLMRIESVIPNEDSSLPPFDDYQTIVVVNRQFLVPEFSSSTLLL